MKCICHALLSLIYFHNLLQIRDVLRDLRTKASLAVRTALFSALKRPAEEANKLLPAERDDLCDKLVPCMKLLAKTAFDVANIEDVLDPAVEYTTMTVS
jgi:hypothetical protein